MNVSQIRKFAPRIRKIARKYGISRVYVSGSTARGDDIPGSDVDFLVEMKEGASLFGTAGFGYEAEALLGVPVDVIPLSLLPQVKDRDFAVSIQKDAVAL
jgi:uncharacterized protein